MCGFIFNKASKIADEFIAQSERGLDGVGCMSKDEWIKWFEPFTAHTHHIDKDLVKKYVAHIEEHFTDPDTMVLLHHRKGSQGSLCLENVHPYAGEKFILFQNGTDRKLRDWGTIEHIDAGWSDTYCLLQYFERHCKNLIEVREQCKFLVSIGVTLGVIVITQGQKALVYSDGERSLYVDTDDVLQTITFSSEYNLDEYHTTGWALFNLSGTLIKEEWTEKNRKKVVTVFPTWNHHNQAWSAPANPATPALATPDLPYMSNKQLEMIFKNAHEGARFNMFISGEVKPVIVVKKGISLVPETDFQLFMTRFYSYEFTPTGEDSWNRIRSLVYIKKNKKQRENYHELNPYDIFD